MKRLVELAVQQKVLVNLMFLLVLGVGIAVFRGLPIDAWPNVSLDEAWIITSWSGAGAGDVERLVTREIEEEIEDVPGIKRIVSTSQPGRSLIDVKFDENLGRNELEASFNDLRTALDRVVDLPESAERPVLQRLTTTEVYPLFSVVMYAETDSVPEIVVRESARRLKRILSDVAGVQRVRYQEFRDRELRVLVDRVKARRHGVTLSDVLAALKRSNVSVPAGSIVRSGEEKPATALDAGLDEVRVKFDGEVRGPEDLADEIIREYPGKAPLRVRDVATVEPRFEKLVQYSRMNGRRAMVLNVAKDDKSDTLALRAAVGRTIEEFLDSGPAGLAVEIVADQSEVVRSRFSILLHNLVQGLALVTLILFFAVGIRNALIALVGVPFAYLCSFWVFPLVDMSVNNLTLFGMVLVGGMLVDDAIITIENIFRRVESGEALRDAVIKGAAEVAWPVFNACLTTVAAMSPLLLQGGVTGKFFSYIPKVVILALTFSVIQCISVLPVHYLGWGSRRDVVSAGVIGRLRAGFFAWLRRAYTKALGFVLRFRLAFLALAGGVSLLLIGLVLQIPRDPWVSDFNAVLASIKCDSRYGLDQTDAAAREVEAVLDDFYRQGDLKNYFTVIGFRMTTDGVFINRPDVAFFMASLADKREILEDPERLANRLRRSLDERLQQSSRHRFELVEVFTPHDGPPLGKPVAVRVECNDYFRAKRVAEQVKQELRAVEGVYGVADNLDLGPRELRLSPDHERAAAIGLFPRDLALALRLANDGLVAGSFKDRKLDEDVDIRVQYAPGDRDRPEDLLLTDVRAGEGLVPLSDVVRVRAVRPNSNYYHYNTRRTVLVTADVDGIVATGPQVNEHLQKVLRDIPHRYPDVRLAFGGEFEETKQSMDAQARSFWIALVLIYIVLAAQFRSYIQPLVVMAVVPFGVLGVLVGLLVRSQPFTIPTFIAMIGLAGVVVNDSLVLVTFINNRRRDGLAFYQAILTGASQRVRAVLLTAATTMGNLLPLAYGFGGSSRVWTPFAVSIVFGMGVASIMTLFMVPVLYSLLVRGGAGQGPPGNAPE